MLSNGGEGDPWAGNEAAPFSEILPMAYEVRHRTRLQNGQSTIKNQNLAWNQKVTSRTIDVE